MEIPSEALLVTTTSDGHIAPLAASPHDNKLLIFLPWGQGSIKKAQARVEILHTVFVFDPLSNKWVICENNSALVLHVS